MNIELSKEKVEYSEPEVAFEYKSHFYIENLQGSNW